MQNVKVFRCFYILHFILPKVYFSIVANVQALA